VKTVLKIISSIGLFSYPFVIYFGNGYFSTTLLAMIILTLLFSRLYFMKDILSKMPWILPATLLGSLAIITSLVTGSNVGFKFYPLMVNGAMFVVFFYSYIKPPSIIEGFARIRHKDLNLQGVNYTAKVTLIWCLFFICNGLASLYTALYASFDIWVLYNGLISYVLMGLLMSVEFIVRLSVKKNHFSSDELTSK